MKVEFIKRHNTHDDDCWCDALSFALDKSYDEMYKLMKPFINKGGSLNIGFFKSMLYSGDYYSMDMECDIYSAIQLIDSSRGIVFIMKEKGKDIKHIVYVKNNQIYDNNPKEGNWYYLKTFNVEEVFYKLDEDYE